MSDHHYFLIIADQVSQMLNQNEQAGVCPSPKHLIPLQAVQHHSPNEETERLFNLPQRQGDEYFDQKETERNFSKAKGKMIVWLTQSGSERSQRDEQWNLQLENSHQHMEEIQSILEQHHIMEVFEAFEELRSVIAEELYQQNNRPYQFTLLQAIETFKAKLSIQQTKSVYHEWNTPQVEMKGLLEKITYLRCQNAKLRQKIQRQASGGELDNSILNNSLSFHSADTLTNSQQSFDITIERQLVRPFFGCESADCSTLQVSSKQHHLEQHPSLNLNCIQSFEVTNCHQEVQTEQEVNKWHEKAADMVMDMKLLFEWLARAVNLCVIKDRAKLKQFSLLLAQTAKCSTNDHDSFIATLMAVSKRMNDLIQRTFNDLQTRPLMTL